MSVDYRSVVVFGWRISEEERQRINEATNYAFEDSFTMLDMYSGSSDSIFGVEMLSVSDGCAKSVNVKHLTDVINNFNDKKSYLCGLVCRCGREDLLEVEPQLFVVTQVY